MGGQPAQWGVQPILATFLLLLNSGAETSLRWLQQYKVELQMNLREQYAKFYNHVEVPYLGLLLIERA